MNNFSKVNTNNNYKDKYLDSSLLLSLWDQLGIKRKLQIIYSSFIVVILGLSEILTLLALQEFLVLLTNPSQIFEYQLTNIILEIIKVDNTNQLLIPLTSLLIFSVILTLIIRLLSLGIIDLLGASIGNELSCKAFKNIMYQPYQAHLSQNSAEIITGVVSYTDAAVKAIKYSVNGFSAFIVSISVIYCLIKIDRNLALISLSISVFGYFIFGILTRSILLKNSRKIAVEQINQIKNVSEGLGAIIDVILRNSYIFYLKRFKKADIKVIRALALNSFISMTPR